jgi:hypothetical protein
MNVYRLYGDADSRVQAAASDIAEPLLHQHACRVFLTMEPFANNVTRHFFDLARRKLNGWPVSADEVLTATGNLTQDFQAKRVKLDKAQHNILAAADRLGLVLEGFDGIWGMVDTIEFIQIDRQKLGPRLTTAQGHALQRAVNDESKAIVKNALVQTLYAKALELKGSKGLAIAELLLLEDPTGNSLVAAVNAALTDRPSGLEGWRPR